MLPIKLVVILLFVTSAAASAQTIGNSGFENPALGNNAFIYDPATGPTQQWTFQQNSGVAQNDSGNFQVSGGANGQFGFLQGTNSATNGIISQTISFNTAGAFQLSYLEAGRVPNGFGPGGDLSYNVTIAPAGGGSAVLNVNDSTISSQPFTLTNYQFTLPNAGNFALTFTAVNAAHNDDTAFFDNVAISAVPEPSLLALVTIGGAIAFVTCSWWKRPSSH
jgi:hypothetical protein